MLPKYGRAYVHWSIVLPLLVITGALIVGAVHPNPQVARIGWALAGEASVLLLVAMWRLTTIQIADRTVDQFYSITEAALASRSRDPVPQQAVTVEPWANN